ncbi:TetR/AcrR family transcriptional regulator [Hyphomonas jannaschiana]|uniref:TetR family transcriptional regulator n=1 Tax=Hyphomonas jannaschiana VP2 TaxID=1280952 RepID=A0A059FEI0_9PROT|nr:TetR/AcrR family transcriptional regulator [Hyphomonas jannaschiana]KCZ89007.1 TetR family transcriptional regulator [Hyphomonas jannaschiana VP2]
MTQPAIPRPRKAPVQARSAATVEAILEAAAHILENEGFDGYTTNAIARRAGVSIGSLYQYFPNKDAVTAALVMADAARLHDDVHAAAEATAGEDFQAQLNALIDVVVAHQLDRPDLARLIDVEERRLATDPALAAKDASVLVLIRDLLVAHRIRLPFDLDSVARDLFGMVHGMCDFAGDHGETDPAQLKARIRHAVLSYLGVPAS